MNTLECFVQAESLRKAGRLEECREFMDMKVASKEMLTSDRRVVLDRMDNACANKTHREDT